MRILRFMLVLLLACVPLLTLFHKDDRDRWDTNRAVMVAPDEASYLLMAQSIATGHGISTTAAFGRDTFYPPGYPAILAIWGKFFGFTAFSMHACTAILSSASLVAAYFLIRRLLVSALPGDSSVNAVAPLLLALCAFNWYVLEGSLIAFSEPAFMLAVFAWLLVMLKWRVWYTCWWQALIVAALAVVAYSIRGAGIVCIATVFLYPIFSLVRHTIFQGIGKKLGCIAIVVLVAVLYMATLHVVSHEKSIAAGANSDNSYSKQLLRGLTDKGSLSPLKITQWPRLAEHILYLMASHAGDFADVFVPQYRMSPQLAVLNPLGRTALFLGLLGLAWRIVASRKEEKSREGYRQKAGEDSAPFDLGRFLWKALLKLSSSGPPKPPVRSLVVELFILLYIALYLLWPFNMPRFWTPILPIMLAYAWMALLEFGGRFAERKRTVALAWAFFGLLLLLNMQEAVTKFPHYQRRLNYVSDCLAESANRIVKTSPDKSRTTVCVLGGDEHFLMAWYLPRAGGEGAGGGGPMPTSPRDSKGEKFEGLLVRELERARQEPGRRVFVFSNFAHSTMLGAIENVREKNPQLMAEFELKKIYQKEIIAAVWELVPRGDPDKN